MLDRTSIRPARPPSDTRPRLTIIIDTEEEFDWSLPFSRGSTGVSSIDAQHRAQDVFAKHGIVPTYVVDYPVATTDSAVRTLRSFHEAGQCEIGAHLHPWVNPPHEETVSARLSYPGNLPAGLEHEKLARLTAEIERNFGARPSVYRAGRYGVGPNTGTILEELGYQVDSSVAPYISFADDGGPDFRRFDFRPYWFGRRGTLLELPLTCGLAGALARIGAPLFALAKRPAMQRARLPGMLARPGLLERIRLSPEGIDHSAHRRLTESLLAQGCRLFSFTYHSPSLEPGHTPYVRDQADLRTFLGNMDAFFRYFIHEVGGAPATPMEIYNLLRRESGAGAALGLATQGHPA